MTDQEFQERSRKQYLDLKEMLQLVLNNQVISGKKLSQLQEDLNTCIRNQQILGNDQDKLLNQVDDIRRLLNK